MDFQAARYLMKGEVPEQVGNDHPTSMPTSAYKTADGYINVGASGDGMWKRLCQAIGRADLASRPEFEGQPQRARNRAPLNAEINEALATRSSAEWIAILNEAGVPVRTDLQRRPGLRRPAGAAPRGCGEREAPESSGTAHDQPGGEALAHARDRSPPRRPRSARTRTRC